MRVFIATLLLLLMGCTSAPPAQPINAKAVSGIDAGGSLQAPDGYSPVKAWQNRRERRP